METCSYEVGDFFGVIKLARRYYSLAYACIDWLADVINTYAFYKLITNRCFT